MVLIGDSSERRKVLLELGKLFFVRAARNSIVEKAEDNVSRTTFSGGCMSDSEAG